MKLVYLPGEVDEERMNILQAADRYDNLRSSLELYTIPPSAFHLAQCRELHDRQVSGPTVSAGWTSFVSGECAVLSSSVLLLGASGSRIYNTGAKRTSRPVGDLLKEYQSYHNMEVYQNRGVGPVDWTHKLRDYIVLHERELTLRSGAGHNPVNQHNNAREHLLFEGMTVIVIDDHNGLCDNASRYVGLAPNEATNETERAKRRKVLGDYCDFFTKLTYFGRVIYCYSPCPERLSNGREIKKAFHNVGCHVPAIWISTGQH